MFKGVLLILILILNLLILNLLLFLLLLLLLSGESQVSLEWRPPVLGGQLKCGGLLLLSAPLAPLTPAVASLASVTLTPASVALTSLASPPLCPPVVGSRSLHCDLLAPGHLLGLLATGQAGPGHYGCHRSGVGHHTRRPLHMNHVDRTIATVAVSGLAHTSLTLQVVDADADPVLVLVRGLGLGLMEHLVAVLV